MWKGSNFSLHENSTTSPAKDGLPAAIAHLLHDIGKFLLCYLRDGRTFLGVLQSIDQFGNVVLSKTIERIYIGLEYGDIERGICIVRGENLVLVGEWDTEMERKSGTKQCDINYILTKQGQDEEKKAQQREALQYAMRTRGLNYRENPEDDFFVK